MAPALLILLAYLLGSVPTSQWVARAVYGVDLRREGSGNLGATNTYRVLGKRAAAPVLVVDVLKGWVPVALFPALDGSQEAAWALGYGGAAVVGHVFSFWVDFRGGKGVATASGVFLALAPWAVVAGAAVWAGVVTATRLVSLGSVLAALTLPVAVYLTPHEGGPAAPLFALALALFVVWTHRSNIRRLREGKEPRVDHRPPASRE